jgi:glycosyltransferase involved in cell wall biosynthesis
MCEAAARDVDVRVVVPTPWIPPGVPIRALSRFNRIPAAETRGAVRIEYPRVPGSVEYFTHALDAKLSFPYLRATARRMHAERPFDLIHAHFIYPDGVIASRLGQELGVPVMTSEHSFWTPWLEEKASVGAQVWAALPGIALVAPVSEFLRQSVATYAEGRVAQMEVLPNVVDEHVFRPGPQRRDPNELLFVGLVRRFKRVDVLLRAVAEVRKQRPELRLRILSSNAFQAYGADRRQMRELIAELDLGSAVTVVAGAGPAEVAEAMRRCSLVVVSSSRRETFCSVAAEALACGAPLAITRCGGPEEFVTPADGVMVEPDDPAALAAGILEVLDRRASFEAADLHGRIVGRFGRDAWCDRAVALYESIVRRRRAA